MEVLIDVDGLAFYDESTSGWSLEKGNYTVYVGTASDDITQKIDIFVK